MKITVVVGNPKAGSRTLRVATAVADVFAAPNAAGEQVDTVVVDLAEVAPDLFDFDSARVADLLALVAGSDLVIVASPTYKATYTGLLKSFLDRYPNNGLGATIAIPVMTGASPIHALAPEVFLRPLLVELGASVPTRGLYVTEAQFDDLAVVVDAWAEGAKVAIERSLGA